MDKILFYDWWTKEWTLHLLIESQNTIPSTCECFVLPTSLNCYIAVILSDCLLQCHPKARMCINKIAATLYPVNVKTKVATEA